MNTTIERAIEKAISSLREKKIRVVVFDMDKTLIGEHSQGIIKKSSLSKLIRSISNIAKKYISRLLEEPGFQVAIASMTDELYTKIYGEHKGGEYLSGG